MAQILKKLIEQVCFFIDFGWIWQGFWMVLVSRERFSVGFGAFGATWGRILVTKRAERALLDDKSAKMSEK